MIQSVKINNDIIVKFERNDKYVIKGFYRDELKNIDEIFSVYNLTETEKNEIQKIKKRYM